MNRAISLTLIWCVSISASLANGPDAAEVTTAPAEAKEAASTAPVTTDSAKVIVTVIGADAKQSEVLRKVVNALEKAGNRPIAG